jgi:DNA-binding XRE family transcriptional regulator
VQWLDRAAIGGGQRGEREVAVPCIYLNQSRRLFLAPAFHHRHYRQAISCLVAVVGATAIPLRTSAEGRPILAIKDRPSWRLRCGAAISAARRFFPYYMTPDMSKRQLGPHQMRAWREWAGITQVDAGKHVGRTHATIGRIENRKLPYSQDILEGLAELYGANSPADLVDRPPPKRRPGSG